MLKLRDIAKKSIIKSEKIASAFSGYDNSYKLDDQTILANFTSTNLYHLLQPVIARELAVHKSIKLIVQYHTILSKLHAVEETKTFDSEISEPYLTAKSRKILTGTNIAMVADEIHQEINKKLEEFTSSGSGWKFEMIKAVLFHTAKYNVLRGNLYVDLPKKIKNKKCCINVKNNDNKCFQWSILSAMFPKEQNSDRVNKYFPHKNELNFDGINFPVAENHIPKFEKQNGISVNVFGLDERENVYPRYISENASQKTINLLFHRGHYCWIKNFNGLVGGQYSKNKNKKYFCYRCLHGFTSDDRLGEHLKYCVNVQKITMPSEKEKILKFKNYNHKLSIPFVIYADFECLLVPVAGAENNPKKSSTRKIQQHIPCGVAYKVVCCASNKFSSPIRLYRGENPAVWLLKNLIDEVNTISNRLLRTAPIRITSKQQLDFDEAVNCHICEQPLGDSKVRDHCHLTGQYRGAAHNSCNLKFHAPDFIPVVLHNFRGYDSHIIVEAFGDENIKAKLKLNNVIKCIPNNFEKYMSVTLGKLRFIDSLQFMAASLDELVKGCSIFNNLRSCFGENYVDLTKKVSFRTSISTIGADLMKLLCPTKINFTRSSKMKISQMTSTNMHKIFGINLVVKHLVIITIYI